MTTQELSTILRDVRRTEELELLSKRVSERARVSWWDRHGERVLWAVAIVLVMAAWWVVTS